MKEEKLISLCKKRRSSAQKTVYEQYAPLLRGVCRRYIFDHEMAEEVLQDGFFRALTKIDGFEWQGNGSLFSWMKRIMVNTALNCIKKNRKLQFEVPISEQYEIEVSDSNDDFFDNENSAFSIEEIIQAVNKIPERDIYRYKLIKR